jgi:HSF-type DNA-binding
MKRVVLIAPPHYLPNILENSQTTFCDSPEMGSENIDDNIKSEENSRLGEEEKPGFTERLPENILSGYDGQKSVDPSPKKVSLPAFLNKLRGMVNSPETDPWVHWSEDGVSFVIPNSQTLAEQVLGHHFKHNNFSSFVRQLNMYGFHKVPHLNHGVLHNDGQPETWEFSNENFHRDDPGKMHHIARKKGEAERLRQASRIQSNIVSITEPMSGDLSIPRAELHQIATRQRLLREEVKRLAANTESLWNYADETRRQCDEQRDKLDKLFKFICEAFRHQAPSADFPGKVRGLIEAPYGTPFEELSSEKATPMTAPVGEPQFDFATMVKNGKIPSEFHEVIQQYLQNNCTPETFGEAAPESTMSPEMDTTLYQAARNSQQVAQIQQWVDQADHALNLLGCDLSQNETYGDYLKDSHFTFDPFGTATTTDASLNTFPEVTVLDEPHPHPSWSSQFMGSEPSGDTRVDRKRHLGDVEVKLGKRARQ